MIWWMNDEKLEIKYDSTSLQKFQNKIVKSWKNDEGICKKKIFSKKNECTRKILTYLKILARWRDNHVLLEGYVTFLNEIREIMDASVSQETFIGIRKELRRSFNKDIRSLTFLIFFSGASHCLFSFLLKPSLSL